ncbi:MAG: 50S ribosomal protein L11 methyltransferase [Bacteroidales bacterium]
MRDYPAIEIRFTAGAGADDDVVVNGLLGGLDDFRPTAIEERAGAWRVFFESAAARDLALAWIHEAAPRVVASSIDVPDDDWARRSQANLGPIQVNRVVVTPPWAVESARAMAAANGAIVVVIVPSTGFGTGHHASTRLCLALLQEIPLVGRSALDIGTGSGVLAIAAALLGAGRAAAVDNDPDAIETARENIALNATPVAIETAVEDLRHSSRPPADVVMANLTGELLCRAAPDVAKFTVPGGRCIVSGVMNHERDRVVSVFATAGLEHLKTIVEDEWVGMLFARGW